MGTPRTTINTQSGWNQFEGRFAHPPWEPNDPQQSQNLVTCDNNKVPLVKQYIPDIKNVLLRQTSPVALNGYTTYVLYSFPPQSGPFGWYNRLHIITLYNMGWITLHIVWVMPIFEYNAIQDAWCLRLYSISCFCVHCGGAELKREHSPTESLDYFNQYGQTRSKGVLGRSTGVALLSEQSHWATLQVTPGFLWLTHIRMASKDSLLWLVSQENFFQCLQQQTLCLIIRN